MNINGFAELNIINNKQVPSMLNFKTVVATRYAGLLSAFICVSFFVHIYIYIQLNDINNPANQQ